MDNIRI